MISGDEQCDDDNTTSGDGCSPTCQIEPGYTCTTDSPSVCAVTCGNGVIDPGEQCDDGNSRSFDGCSSTCQIEAGWTCNGTPSGCDGTCGDGIRVGDEQCDDGNGSSGDGCSSTCEIEPGYSCRAGHLCEATLCQIAVVDDGNGDPTVYMRGNYLEMGLGSGAAFGTNDNEPDTTWHARSGQPQTEIGFVADPDATSWTAYHGDFFTPGAPVEGWFLELDGQSIGNDRDQGNNVPGTFGTPSCQASELCGGFGGASVTWSSTAPVQGPLGPDETPEQVQIAQQYTVINGGVFIVVDVTVTNVGTADVTDLYYMRSVDPDNDETLYPGAADSEGNFTTNNTIVANPDGGSNTIALVTAEQDAVGGITTQSTLALVANDARAKAAYGGFANSQRTRCGPASRARPARHSMQTKRSRWCSTCRSPQARARRSVTPTTSRATRRPRSCARPRAGTGSSAPTSSASDGNSNDGDGCSSTCEIEPHYGCTGSPSVCTPTCGDGFVLAPEGCDDGNNTNGDGCSSTCTVEPGWACATNGSNESVCAPICGDGLLVGSEACDDGNGSNGDGCSSTCTIEPGWMCMNGSGDPASTCTTTCGDGIIVGTETCDDGNGSSGDGCSSSCTIEPGWMCTGQPSACSTTCGDGIVAGPEGCDDGNTHSGDGCSSTCTVEPGWVCHAGSGSGTDGSASVCSDSCGDGVVTGGEQCDDGNTHSGDGCSQDCTIEPGYACTGAPSVCTANCGDGMIDGSEQCDDGNTHSGDGCSSSCGIEPGWMCAGQPSSCITTCGDGLRVGAEQCDDGNTHSGDGCSSSCTVEPGWTCSGTDPDTCHTICGDGILAGMEACDDGNTVSGDGCSSTCMVEPGYTCNMTSPTTCTPTPTAGPDAGSRNGGFDDGLGAAGGGCDAGGAGGGLGLAFGAIGLLLVTRRRRAAVATAGAIAVGAVAAPALADVTPTQDFSIERFRLAMDKDGVIGAESAAIPANFDFDAAAWLSYATDPLVVTNPDGTRNADVIKQRTALTLVGSIGLFDRLQVGLEVPIIFDQGSSDQVVGPDGELSGGISSAGFGDIRLIPKVGLLKQSEVGIDLAVIPSVTFPSSGGGAYRGESTLTFAPEVAVSHKWDVIRIAADVGYRLRKDEQLLNLDVNDEIFGFVGVGYRAADPRIEFDASFAFATSASSPFGAQTQDYEEILGGAAFDLGPFALGLVGGAGVDHGYGTPDWRLVATLRLTRGSLTSTQAPVGDPTVAQR